MLRAHQPSVDHWKFGWAIHRKSALTFDTGFTSFHVARRITNGEALPTATVVSIAALWSPLSDAEHTHGRFLLCLTRGRTQTRVLGSPIERLAIGKETPNRVISCDSCEEAVTTCSYCC